MQCYALQAEVKKQKAREEYANYIGKYSKVTVDFESKLSESARMYQEHERTFIVRAQSLFTALAQATEAAATSQTQVSTAVIVHIT